MKKFIIGLIAFSAVLTANAAMAENTTVFQPEKSFQMASMQFLPDLKDSEIGFGDRNLKDDQDFNKGDQDCSDYNYSKSNCSRNRSLYNPCPFDPNKFKACTCNTTKYNINKSNCSYTGSNYSYADFLGTNRCTDDGKEPVSTQCLCLSKFIYTTNSSCGDAKKIIDTSSYCQQEDQTRYEKCKCDPQRFPYTYTGGDSYSAGFKSAVKAKCGNEDNFFSCNQDKNVVNYACAITDTSYKHTVNSCKKENTDWTVQGYAKYFYNGNNIYISLYNTCDCPTDYVSSNRCPTASARRTDGETPSPSCFIVGHDLKDHTERQYGKTCNEVLSGHGSLLTSKSCKKRDGSYVYSDKAEDCYCDMPGASYRRYNDDTCWKDWTKSSQWCVTCRNADGLFLTYRTAGKNS